MSIRREGRGRRATLAARVATACAALAAVLAVTAPTASAYVPCPAAIPSMNIDGWQTNWPTAGADAKGVTLCLGFSGVPPMDRAWLQIVDLNDGAKLRLVSETDGAWGSSKPDTSYQKRTADDWFSWIRDLDDEWDDEVIAPGARRLFSTTNASFFKCSDLTGCSTTTLPFPHWFSQAQDTVGVASGNPSDPDHSAPKRSLRLGTLTNQDGDIPVQRVTIAPFPTYYDWYDARTLLADENGSGEVGTSDATVAFAPDYVIGDSSRRNYIGTYGNVVYIFTSHSNYTNAQVNEIMQQIRPGMYTMQLDGGGSAQFHSDYGHMDSNIPVLDRSVPDVLAVYRAE